MVTSQPFCVSCGQVGHTMSSCINEAAHPDYVYQAWCNSPADVCSIQPKEPQPDFEITVFSANLKGEEGPMPPVMVTCGSAQIQRHLEQPYANLDRTLMSIHLLLASEQEFRPKLTLEELRNELQDKPGLVTQETELKMAEGDEPVTLETMSPVPVTINVDGVDLKFDASIVTKGDFPQGLCLGKQELRCYNINCLLYTSPSPRDLSTSRMPSSA